MSQRKIESFFKAKPTAAPDIPEKNASEKNVEKESSPSPLVNGNAKSQSKDPSPLPPKSKASMDSPVKSMKSKSHKRIRVLDSDDEDEQSSPMEEQEESSPKESVTSSQKEVKESSKKKRKTDLQSPISKEDNSSGSKAGKKSKSPRTRQTKEKRKTDLQSPTCKEDNSSENKAGKKSKSPRTRQPNQKNKGKKAKASNSPKSSEKEDAEEINTDEKCQEKEETEKKDQKARLSNSPKSPESDVEEIKTEEKCQEKEDAENKGESAEEKPAPSELEDKAGQPKASLSDSSKAETDYDPSKAKYDPCKDAIWKAGEKVPYLALAITLEKIEATPGRLRMIEILSNFLRSVIALSPDDLLPCIYLCLNKVAPDYAGIELGMGDMVLMKALAQATGRTVDKIKAELAVKGDLGLVAQSSRGTQRLMFTPPKLLVRGVFSKLKEIAHLSGNAAMSKKVDLTKGMFVACRHVEAKYLIRSLSGKLRIGLAEQSILQALAQALTLGEAKNMKKEEFEKKLEKNALIIKTAYCECPNYDLIISTLLKDGLEALPEKCRIVPGIPVKPMLANPTKGVAEVLQRFDNIHFTCEYKYDGERAQIHRLENGDIKIYSRSQEDNTSKYPDIISRLPNSFEPGTESFIMDAEAVAWDRSTQTILPFQILSTRKRKDAVESEIKVQVCIFAFDLLYLNGKSLVRCPFRERRELLHSAIHEVPDELKFAQYKDLESPDDIQAFLDESVQGSCEGLMIKTLDVEAHYEIAKRSRNWLKLKKDYLEGLGDSLDLVVIGGYYGKGKRTGTYGGFLLACYDEDNEEYQSICKIGTGFKDDDLEEHTKFLKEHILEGGAKSYYRYDPSLEPDEWFSPEQVWEVKCGDISKSPVHRAAIGIVDPEKGVSLRFPRFIRIRTDKKPEQATSASQVAKMYHNQKQIKNISSASASKTQENEDEEMY